MPKTFRSPSTSLPIQKPATDNQQPTTDNQKKGVFPLQKQVFSLYFFSSRLLIFPAQYMHILFTNLNHLQLHQNVKNSTPKQANLRQRPVSNPCRNCKIRLRLRHRDDVQHSHAVLALRPTHSQTKTLRPIRLSRRS